MKPSAQRIRPLAACATRGTGFGPGRRRGFRPAQHLGLKPKMQSLVSDHGRMYDVLTVTDPKTGQERKLWFDINSFFGKEF
jgi:hypothetical protein